MLLQTILNRYGPTGNLGLLAVFLAYFMALVLGEKRLKVVAAAYLIELVLLVSLVEFQPSWMLGYSMVFDIIFLAFLIWAVWKSQESWPYVVTGFQALIVGLELCAQSLASLKKFIILNNIISYLIAAILVSVAVRQRLRVKRLSNSTGVVDAIVSE